MRNISGKKKGNIGCPLGNQTPNSGCPEPFSGCPGRPDTRFVKPCTLSDRSQMIGLTGSQVLGAESEGTRYSPGITHMEEVPLPSILSTPMSVSRIYLTINKARSATRGLKLSTPMSVSRISLTTQARSATRGLRTSTIFRQKFPPTPRKHWFMAQGPLIQQACV